MIVIRLSNRAAAFAIALACAAVDVSAQTTKPAAPSAVSAEAFMASLHAAKPGDVLLTSFPKLDASLPTTDLAITPSADVVQMAFSDRPEYFRTGDGIASQDVVTPGHVRFYTYHVPIPADGKARRIISLFENMGDAEAKLVFNARSEPAIGGDYGAIAKEGMTALLSNTGKGEVMTIPPHGHEILKQNDPVNQPDLLAHALLDFTTDQPLRISVAQVTATRDLQADVASIASLPKLSLVYKGKSDSSGRGLFPTADFDVSFANTPYDTATGPVQVIVANGKSSPWIEGVDGISGEKTTDKGNYGVIYHLKLKFKSTDGRGVAMLLTTSRFESEYCGLIAAAVRVNDGKNPGGVIPMPRGDVRFHGIPQACVIQTFDAPANGGERTIELDYTPPGACCLPTPILLVPIDK